MVEEDERRLEFGAEEVRGHYRKWEEMNSTNVNYLLSRTLPKEAKIYGPKLPLMWDT